MRFYSKKREVLNSHFLNGAIGEYLYRRKDERSGCIEKVEVQRM